MTRTDEADPPAGLPAEPPERPRVWTLGRVSAAIVLAALIGMWVYVLAVRWTQNRPIDHLDVVTDHAWDSAADDICSISDERLATVPTVPDDASPEERAVAIGLVTDELERRVADLRTLTPVDADDRDLIVLWFDDWDVHLDDRRAYAAELAGGAEVVFNGTATVDGETITRRMDSFAYRNHIQSCDVADDLGE